MTVFPPSETFRILWPENDQTLIPRANPDRIFDTTVKPDFGSMQEGLKETDEWLKRQGVGDEIRNRVVLAMEESVKNVIQHGLSKRRKSAIDVRISRTG